MSNCILVTIDCLRPDFLGCYGHGSFASPNIDYLAHKGILFASAFANGVGTPAAFPSILASIYPTMCGHKLGIWNHLTIAEVLRKSGYVTAAIHSNPYLSEYFGYDKGFDSFYYLVPHKEEKRVSVRLGPLKSFLSKKYLSKVTDALKKLSTPIHRRKSLHQSPYADADVVTKTTLQWIRRYRKENFFLWIHYMDLHFPHRYFPSTKYPSNISEKDVVLVNMMYSNPKFVNEDNISKLKRIYEAELRFVDAMIGIIIRELNRLGIFDKTSIIITSDHGEEFFEHGKIGHDPRLYDELIHIPLIIYSSELKREKGKRVTELCSQIDISPTILDLLGEHKQGCFLGRSVIPLISGEYSNKYIISEAPTEPNKIEINLQLRKVALRTSNWKFIWSANGRHELYNLSIGEHTNLINEEVNKAEELKKLILKHIKWEERERIKMKMRNLKRKLIGYESK